MLETVYHVLKITVIVAICSAFMLAISGLLNLLSTIIFTSVVGEILGIVSCCLPFNAISVFGLISTAITAILTFLVAKKIFELSSWGVSAT